MIPPRWVHFKKVEKVEGTFKGTGTRTVSRLVLLPCTYMHRVEGTKVLYCTLYYYIKIYCFLLRSEYYITYYKLYVVLPALRLGTCTRYTY